MDSPKVIFPMVLAMMVNVASSACSGMQPTCTGISTYTKGMYGTLFDPVSCTCKCDGWCNFPYALDTTQCQCNCTNKKCCQSPFVYDGSCNCTIPAGFCPGNLVWDWTGFNCNGAPTTNFCVCPLTDESCSGATPNLYRANN